MPKAIVLDLGNVVFRLDWETPLRLLGLKGTPTETFLLNEFQTWPVYDQYERGALSTEVFISEMGKLAQRNFEPKEFEKAWAHIVGGYLPGVKELLPRLAEKFPLYALTNTSPLHLKHILETYPELIYFRKVFNSVDMKARKPEREIFLRVQEEIGVRPRELFYVDDIPSYVEAAKTLGWKAAVCDKGDGGLQKVLAIEQLLVH